MFNDEIWHMLPSSLYIYGNAFSTPYQGFQKPGILLIDAFYITIKWNFNTKWINELKKEPKEGYMEI